MRDSSNTDNRGNMERMGESAGAMAGRAADFGMEVTGALFRSAAEMLGGWWSSDAPRQAAGGWNDQAESRCRSHYQSNAGSSGGSNASGGMHASGSVGGASASMSAGGSAQSANVAPKSQHAAMQSAGEMSTDTGSGSGGVGFDASAQVGGTRVSGSAHLDAQSSNRQGAGSTTAASGAGSASGGGMSAAGRAQAGGASMEGAVSMDSASDGFAHARPGYQLGYVARQNPAYKGRTFRDIEPELQRVWESRAKTEGGSTGSSSSWPEVRGFVDFAYQQGE